MARKRSAKAERERDVRLGARYQERASVDKRKKTLAKEKQAKRGAMGEARAQCRVDIERTKETTRAAFQQTVGKARSKRDQERGEACARCDAGKRAVAEEHDPLIQKAAKDLQAEHDFHKQTRRLEAINKDRHRERQRSRGSRAAKMQEANEEVVQNLPPELVPVWHSVKGVIKAKRGRSRLEAFQDYLHDNPDVVNAIHERRAAKELARLEKEAAQFYAEQKAKRPRPRKGRARREEDPDIGDVVGETIEDVFSFFDDLAGQNRDERAA